MHLLNRKLVMLTLAMILAFSAVLAGCGNKSNKEGNLAGEQVFKMNLFSEPPSLDPGLSQDNNSFTVLNAIFEGLTRLDESAQIQPGVAESWVISDDGKTYTFTLRSEAKWSNGQPVKASDFEYAWKRVLDPNAEQVAPYAYQLYYIKNAEQFNTGEMTDASAVGVRADGDNKLIVELVNPTPYFLKLTAFFTYYPVHQATAEGNAGWASEADTFVSNGPFKINEWSHNELISLVQNEHYYGIDEIKFDEVRLSMIDNSATELGMYETGDLDWAGRPIGEIPLDMIPRLKEDAEANLQIKPIASAYYYVFNTTAKPMASAKVRKALSMAIDRQMIVDEVTKGGQEAAYGFVGGVSGVNKPYRDEVPDDYFKEDVTEAKQLLAEGLQEQGLSAFPTTTLIHNAGEGHTKVATAITDMWRKNLGIEVKIESQEFGVLLNNRTNLNYQIARAGWGADYDDPMTYIDLFTSNSGNNDTGWKSATYDELVKNAYAETDAQKRMDIIANAEALLMDEMIIMPIYYYTAVWMNKSYVEGVYMDYAGNIDFNRGYIAAE
jgi:oligopeptide transport system substrate-binding protein